MSKRVKKVGKVPAQRAGSENVAHEEGELSPELKKTLIRSEHLRGARGTRGEKGEVGRRGRRGLKGEQGDKGESGEAGTNGLDGIAGRDGKDGVKGIAGRQGDQGPQGIPGPIGPRPRHKWNGTKLSFENPNGEFGREVNLKGDTGGRGMSGSAGKAANFHLQTKDVTIQLPQVGDNIRYFFTDKRISVKKLVYVLAGPGGSDATVNIRFGGDRSSVGTFLIIGGTVVADQTSGQTIVDFDNAVIPANSHVVITVTALTLVPTEIAATLFYS